MAVVDLTTNICLEHFWLQLFTD